MERMNIDQIAHSLSLCGMPAYRATILNLVAGMNELQEQVEELQGLVSEEMMAAPGRPEELREVVAELGHGWRIKRQPNDTQDGTTVEDVDRQMAGVGRLLAANQRAFVHSPGYPEDDGEMAGANQLPDVVAVDGQ